ncbi:carboxymuconolactone decarboxylase family protein [Massilia sp. CF038]|jgi:uncharacterized peroxidase-related enzyme|uniref:carboxymuconolactone decarboxylase family protein n=1 Tax=Massilia sp. CF038 TaxID=1881045 RepID=UPI0009204364|nr:carboxymuconolactone decarboxylase family protein [Massilia sp. CF038]SHG65108.1 uncharacterized peroxidase-related enzyme [Massilia sp. CF038]
MSRLHTIPAAQATGAAATLFAAIKGKIGMVPNAYAVIGNNSPLALEAALALDGALAKSSLSAREIEVVKLVVSEGAACDYCLAAHTLIGKKAGLSKAAILALRHGTPSADERADALATFVREVGASKGTVAAPVLAAVKSAGYTDAQVVDALLVIASITFTNLVNRVNDTALDFPAAD